MSRIGKRIINIPDGVEINISNNVIKAKGKLGELSYEFDNNLKVTQEDKELKVDVLKSDKKNKKFISSIHGTTNANINNMIIGVSKGYKKEMKVIGVGYKVKLQGTNLEMSLGFSHPVIYKIPEGVKIEVSKPTEFSVSGIDKVLVGNTAAQIRDFKKPEPYGGKGIRYVDERVIRKAGKQAQ